MKKLLISTAIIVSAFTAVSSASAYEDKTLGNYSGWAFEAMADGR